MTEEELEKQTQRVDKAHVIVSERDRLASLLRRLPEYEENVDNGEVRYVGITLNLPDYPGDMDYISSDQVKKIGKKLVNAFKTILNEQIAELNKKLKEI
jgi:hypothetical protein